MKYNLYREDDAVSPVIGVAMLLGLTVVVVSMVGITMIGQVQEGPNEIEANLDVGMVDDEELKVMVDGPSKMDYAYVEIDGSKQPQKFREVGDEHVYNLTNIPSSDTSKQDKIIVIGVLNGEKKVVYDADVKPQT